VIAAPTAAQIEADLGEPAAEAAEGAEAPAAPAPAPTPTAEGAPPAGSSDQS
jgi:hypothetical protein